VKCTVFLVCATTLLLAQVEGGSQTEDATMGTSKALPAPRKAGKMSVEEAIARRRSVREFAEKPLTKAQIAQLCWAGQGITDRAEGLRASPSAGALYPIELYVVTAAGVDRYAPDSHALRRHLAEDVRPALQAAALGQEPVGEAPVTFVVAAVVERTARKYGRRAERYCFMEAGHVAQNILLQATALGLAGVPVGAFDDEPIAEVLKLPRKQRVLYLLPVGRPQ
jgi:SagB-type dehydrogenase family enzyme